MACRHYRHSHRWLRFPCCGARYACDLCHEEGADHEAVWAKAMVCGYCSTEQPCDSRCRACGRRLAATAAAPQGRRSTYWEGGEGQRDPRRMSKKDPRKYRLLRRMKDKAAAAREAAAGK